MAFTENLFEDEADNPVNKGVDPEELEQMMSWLHARGLIKYGRLLCRNEVYNVHDLALLTAEDLADMGITAIGARRKLYHHIMQLKGVLTPLHLPALSPSKATVSQSNGDWQVGPAPAPSIYLSPAPLNQMHPASEKFVSTMPAHSSSLPSSPVKPAHLKPLSFKSKKTHSGKQDDSMYSSEVVPLIEQLEGQKAALENINEMANLLLTQKKVEMDQSPLSPHDSPNAVNVGFFCKRIQDRLEYWRRSSTPQLSFSPMATPTNRKSQVRRVRSFPATTTKLPKVDYRSLIEQQTAMNDQLDRVHIRYQELLADCLEHLERERQSGDVYGDRHEKRLTDRLAMLVGIAERPDTAELQEADAEFQACLGVTEQTLLRRARLEEEFNELLRLMGKKNEDILDAQEVRQAWHDNPQVRACMEVLAFNLASDPENRMVTLSKTAATRMQIQLEEILKSVSTSPDGFITREDIKRIPMEVRDELMKLGMPNVFH